jgi:hypothetical protein
MLVLIEDDDEPMLFTKYVQGSAVLQILSDSVRSV